MCVCPEHRTFAPKPPKGLKNARCRLPIHSLFRHSVDPPLDGARFLLQHPFFGTLCHWTSSHHPLWLFFVNALIHFYFVNRHLIFYCSFTVHAFVVSVIVSIWATVKNLDWLIDWLKYRPPTVHCADAFLHSESLLVLLSWRCYCMYDVVTLRNNYARATHAVSVWNVYFIERLSCVWLCECACRAKKREKNYRQETDKTW